MSFWVDIDKAERSHWIAFYILKTLEGGTQLIHLPSLSLTKYASTESPLSDLLSIIAVEVSIIQGQGIHRGVGTRTGSTKVFFVSK